MWIVASVLLFILEILTPGFVLACFGVGALGALIPALLGLGLVWQIGAFCIVSFLALFLLRPFVQRISRGKKEIKTAADSLVGSIGVVSETIENGRGRVAIDGDHWRAESEEPGQTLEKGTKVRVVARESIVLTVKPL